MFVWWADLVVTLDNWSQVLVMSIWSTWGIMGTYGLVFIASTYVDYVNL